MVFNGDLPTGDFHPISSCPCRAYTSASNGRLRRPLRRRYAAHTTHHCTERISLLNEGNFIELLVGYKSWADERILESLMELPDSDLIKEQKIVFCNLINTINHVHRIDCIWKYHLNNAPHNYKNKTPTIPYKIDELAGKMSLTNSWYHEYFKSLQQNQLHDTVSFNFINGESGLMTRGNILLHVCNHATYHRGHVADILYNLGAKPPVTDLPVYMQSLACKGSATLA